MGTQLAGMSHERLPAISLQLCYMSRFNRLKRMLVKTGASLEMIALDLTHPLTDIQLPTVYCRHQM